MSCSKVWPHLTGRVHQQCDGAVQSETLASVVGICFHSLLGCGLDKAGEQVTSLVLPMVPSREASCPYAHSWVASAPWPGLANRSRRKSLRGQCSDVPLGRCYDRFCFQSRPHPNLGNAVEQQVLAAIFTLFSRSAIFTTDLSCGRSRSSFVQHGPVPRVVVRVLVLLPVASGESILSLIRCNGRSRVMFILCGPGSISHRQHRPILDRQRTHHFLSIIDHVHVPALNWLRAIDLPTLK